MELPTSKNLSIMDHPPPLVVKATAVPLLHQAAAAEAVATILHQHQTLLAKEEAAAEGHTIHLNTIHLLITLLVVEVANALHHHHPHHLLQVVVEVVIILQRLPSL